MIKNILDSYQRAFAWTKIKDMEENDEKMFLMIILEQKRIQAVIFDNSRFLWWFMCDLF
jgi:hypothetical protein